MSTEAVVDDYLTRWVQHNPNNPVTSASEVQKVFQNRGIKHGETDLKESGGSAPNISIPHLYAK